MLGLNENDRRAISIEVGMQNSGLGVALATAHFSPLAALPSVWGAIWHNISGQILATIWSKKAFVDEKDESDDALKATVLTPSEIVRMNIGLVLT